jgi:hypothetical protein
MKGQTTVNELERIINHARNYHAGRFFIIGLGRGLQGGYGDFNTPRAKAAPVCETIDALLRLLFSLFVLLLASQTRRQ